MPVQIKSKLIKKEQLKFDIFKFSLEAKDITDIAKPRTIHRNKNNRYTRSIFKKANKYI